MQPTCLITESDRSPGYLKKMSRSDITTSTFQPQSVSEALFQSVIFHRANSFSVSRASLRETSWIEHPGDSGVSLFPVLSVGKSCAICGGMLLEQMKVLVQPCEHLYCKTCFVAYLEQRVSDGQVRRIPCPTFECATLISEEQLRSHLAPELYERYCQYRLNLDVESNPWIRHCPKPDCPGYAEGSLGKSKLRCSFCNFLFCFYCLSPWHESTPCAQDQDRQLDRWAKANDVRFCPNCRRRVERASGCEHMTCLKCRYDWCWECGEEYTSSHADKCEVRKNWRRNPPLLVTLGLLLAPVLLPFVFIIAGLYYVEALRRDAVHREDGGVVACIKSRWKAYPILILVTLVLTPFAFLLFFLLAGGLLILESRHLLRNKELGVDKQRQSWLLTALCVGLLLCPVTVLATLVGVGVLHVAGVLFLLKKGYIWLRRRCDQTYGLPKGAPGYLH